jgi:hypothetical protein
VCDIPGDECGDQGWVQGDKNYDEGSYDRCGEKVSAIGDEDMGDEREDEFGKRVAVKFARPGTVVAANVDPAACWSIWLEWMTFWAGRGTDFEEGGEANAADGHSLDIAGRETIDIMFRGILFPGYEIRVMPTLPSRMLLGREFMRRHNMELDLGRGLGSFEVKAKHGRARFNGSIRYGKREVDTSYSVMEVQESIEAVGEEHIRDAIEAMDVAEFGDAEDQRALREMLVEYRDLLRPTTSIVRGPDFSIKLRDVADIPQLNRVAFRNSPLENKVEEVEMKKLLERGIIEPSISPCGTSNVMVAKKTLPDGTLGGLRVTADMKAVNAVTVGDPFPTEDIVAVIEWLTKNRCYSVADLKDGYWNVWLAEEERGGYRWVLLRES